MTILTIPFDKETVYDEQIAPLVSTLISICQEHDIPMLASFCYAADDGGESLCTTALIESQRTPAKFKKACAVIMVPNAMFAAFTLRSTAQ